MTGARSGANLADNRDKEGPAVTDEFLSQTDLARELDVSRATVSAWRVRHADFPVPDVMVGDAPGWRRERVDEVRAWMAARPGQGAGGGRPRKQD